ncbi:MAG: SDR family oxidoreductase [Chloroflexi bacterium]|nr:SDR family oxidoreductase [Chloroflexota bacterium]
MKVVVFGATGKTGQHVCQKALAEGHSVTAFTRSASKIDGGSPNLRAAQGDVNDPEAVAAAIANQDAAIVALGSNGLGDKTTLTAGTRNVVEGMTRHNVRRIVVLSAAGVGESWRQTPLLARIMFKTMLRNIYSDHQAQEALVEQSSLDWTIVRAAILKDDPESGNYTASNTGKVKNISRADLADFLVKQVNDSAYREQAISITS